MPPGHLPGHFIKPTHAMPALPRWLKFVLSIALGIALGLVYGWVINPPDYVDITPASLAPSYRTDAVLMVATIYHADGDLDAAALRLSLLGSDPPAVLASRALTHAFEQGLPDPDILLLQELTAAIQTWQPVGGAP